MTIFTGSSGRDIISPGFVSSAVPPGMAELRPSGPAFSTLGGDGRDFLSGDGGNDRIDGGAGGDAARGGAGDDLNFGRKCSDHLSGGDGRDRIESGEGDGTIVGGAGGDSLVGGAGAGVFAFHRPSDAGARAGSMDVIADVIADVIPGEDWIDVTDDLMPLPEFIGGDATLGPVEVDASADGLADRVAARTGAPALTAADVPSPR
jgi:Ca2+-binding RTX toxin-like protein